jgi:hypothetical protein
MAFTTSFHWGAPADPSWCEPARFIDACRRAEAAGFASVDAPAEQGLVGAVGLAAAAVDATRDIRVRLTCPSAAALGVALADARVTRACKALGSRLILHVKMDADRDVTDEGLADAGAALASWRSLFVDAEAPQIDVEGQSAEAAFLAIRHADRLWRPPDRSTRVDGDAWPILHFGTHVGLVASLVARKTRSEALAAAAALLRREDLEDDGASWTAPCVWAGHPSAPDPRAPVLIGSFDELVRAIQRFERGGISSLLIRGWGVHDIDDREMGIIASNIVPVVRTASEPTGQPRSH